MNKIYFLLFFSISIFSKPCQSIDIQWQGNWAFNCDFIGNDLSNLKVKAEECGPKCEQTPTCTHFTWTSYQGGTCWMKKGAASKTDAFYSNGPICGISSIAGQEIQQDKPLNCISYEPFSNRNYPSNVDQALKETLSSVVGQGFTCIKTYYAQYYGLRIADYAQRYNLKIILGIRMGESFTESEIQSAITSCKANYNILGIYTGNENLPNSQFTQDIINIKNRVKAAGCNLPFGTVQTIGYFLSSADQNLVNQMDWLGYNVYPFFSNLGGGTSKNSLIAQINQLKNAYGTRFSKFRIAETGWPTAGGSSAQGNPATIAKAKEYADSFAEMMCSGAITSPWVSYFIFFDPMYKKNVPEFEKYFGLIDQNGNPKWNIKNLNC